MAAGISYIGNDPTELPSTDGKNNTALHVIGGKLEWSGLKLNSSTIDVDTIIPSGANAMLVGPVTVGDATITVEDGATLIVL